MKVETALQILAQAMRPDDEQHEQHDDAGGVALRPMSYFGERPAVRANADNDAPLTMQPVLLAKPSKKREAA